MADLLRIATTGLPGGSRSATAWVARTGTPTILVMFSTREAWLIAVPTMP